MQAKKKENKFTKKNLLLELAVVRNHYNWACVVLLELEICWWGFMLLLELL
jgi:hypothetical protein